MEQQHAWAPPQPSPLFSPQQASRHALAALLHLALTGPQPEPWLLEPRLLEPSYRLPPPPRAWQATWHHFPHSRLPAATSRSPPPPAKVDFTFTPAAQRLSVRGVGSSPSPAPAACPASATHVAAVGRGPPAASALHVAGPSQPPGLPLPPSASARVAGSHAAPAPTPTPASTTRRGRGRPSGSYAGYPAPTPEALAAPVPSGGMAVAESCTHFCYGPGQFVPGSGTPAVSQIGNMPGQEAASPALAESTARMTGYGSSPHPGCQAEATEAPSHATLYGTSATLMAETVSVGGGAAEAHAAPSAAGWATPIGPRGFVPTVSQIGMLNHALPASGYRGVEQASCTQAAGGGARSHMFAAAASPMSAMHAQQQQLQHPHAHATLSDRLAMAANGPATGLGSTAGNRPLASGPPMSPLMR